MILCADKDKTEPFCRFRDDSLHFNLFLFSDKKNIWHTMLVTFV